MTEPQEEKSCHVRRWETMERTMEGRNRELTLECEMPVPHPLSNAEGSVGYIILEFRVEVNESA